MSAPSPTAIGSRRIWAPPSPPPRLLRPRGMLSMTSMSLSTRCWRNSRLWRQTARDDCGPVRSRPWLERRCARRSWPLVRGILRHAMAGDRPAVRYPVRHAVHAVRPLDPAWSAAPPAQPLDPVLAAGLRRYCRSPLPSSSTAAPVIQRRLASARGFDGGKKIKGIKVHLAVDKYGFPLAISVSPANRHDSKGIVPVLHQLAGRGFKGTALGDLSYRGQRLSKPASLLTSLSNPAPAAMAEPSFRREFLVVVERSLAWISRYRRLR